MAETLEQLLSGPDILIVPGAHDALSARLAVRAGARAVYMTGVGVVGASFALPDLGLVGPEQMTERVRALAAAIGPVPLIADGDNGHGGPLNVARLTRAYEQAGAACIQLEDQVLPKRCGHMAGKEVVPLAEAAAKVRAAVDARSSRSFKIIARTDARAPHGLDEALRRCEAFLAAGADILFLEAPRDEAELARVARTFQGTPLLANMVADGKTTVQSPEVLQQMGYKIALYSIDALLAAVKTLEAAYARVLAGGVDDPTARVGFNEYNNIIGLPDHLARAERYKA